ncbi:WhiB family transcriptional regulator [Streptomyces piniterrae]|uniref:Transcriptional regulator WhiB n=1 Tax=Streptomyces piniterrae TaxID=2571125 RepID=A0A4U0NMS9_9ACTN|nr:WhiB family transcriptional regulator [Streptomyces piniterrae]TJZ55590.1 WhiB family transcriptional regulator [Streptomyces piniterrae]
MNLNLPAFLAHGTAACATADPELFHATTGADQAAAKDICGGCRLRPDCLSWALDNDERIGVWGGLTAKERGQLKLSDGRWLDDEGRIRLACGTAAALTGHHRYGETCETCTQAQADRVEAGRRERLATAHATPEGGSRRGYELHRMLDETPCVPCKRAASAAAQASKARCAARAARFAVAS